MSSTLFNELGSSRPGTPSCVTDWSRCVLCQEINTEPLQCTSKSKSNPGAGYQSLADNLTKFADIGAVPFNTSRLDEGYGIKETLEKRRASWHKSCVLRYNKTKLKRAEKRKSKDGNHEDEPCRKYTRLGESTITVQNMKCFFCESDDNTEQLHEASCFRLNERVRECAHVLQDSRLLAKLSAGDLVALEAKYHSRCLVALYNKAERKTEKHPISQRSDQVTHGLVLAELLAYMDETRQNSETVPIFKLCELSKLYTNRLEQFGHSGSTHVHTTRLKERILAHFPDLQAHTEGRDVLLVFDEDVGKVLRKTLADDYDDNGIHLAKAADIVRKDMLQTKSTFNGTFSEECQKDSLSKLLLSLVEMILQGPSITDQSEHSENRQSALSIAQLMMYHSQSRRSSTKNTSYHSRDRETPLPIYLALKVHALTRKRDLIDALFHLGLSVSYDRVLALTTDLANCVSEQYNSEGLVCPLKLKEGLFTTGALDNIDHNPSSSTAKGSFHGTSISMFQHPTTTNQGRERKRTNTYIPSSIRTELASLPETFSCVPPVIFRDKDPPIPPVTEPLHADDQVIQRAVKDEYRFVPYNI